MNLRVNHTDDKPVEVVVKRQTGSKTAPMSITISDELRQTINHIAVNSKKTRSLVIKELIEKGLEK